jgi:hypothetical protein
VAPQPLPRTVIAVAAQQQRNRFSMGKRSPYACTQVQRRQHPVAELLPTPNEKTPAKTGFLAF